MNNLVTALREAARAHSQASELWAKGKSARNQAAGDEGASYMWQKPEDTLPWKAADEIERLGKLVYVPGLWRCAKCEFQLIQANLNAGDGTVTARDQAGDKCPNCNSPLWRVTERQAGNDVCDRLEARVVEHAGVRRLVDEQAKDEALWFVAGTAPEAYLQRALRELHAAIENKTGDECARAILATESRNADR